MDKYLLIALIIVLGFALYKLITLYHKYKNISDNENLTGYDVARKILDKNKLEDLYIVETKGIFNDHFDYKQKVVRLSSCVYHDTSIYSYVMASFIATQAVLQKENNQSYMVKKMIEPIYKILLVFSYLLMIVGLLLGINGLLLGTVFLTICLLYHIFFLNFNIAIKNSLEEELMKLKVVKKSNEEELKACLEIINYYDIAELILYIKVVIDFIVDKLKKI